MRTWILVALLVVALPLCFGTGCGGGGPSEPFQISGLEGGWFGPVGMSSQTGGLVGPTGGMTMPTNGSLRVSATGAVSDIVIPGTPPGVTAQVSPFDPTRRIYTFVRSDMVKGILVASPDMNHIAWMDENFLFAAMQRVADPMSPPPAVPFALADIENTMWAGTMTGTTPTLMPSVASRLTMAAIGMPPTFNLATDLPYTAMSTMPLAFTDTMVGALEGDDFQDSFMAPNGKVHALMTRDKQFVAFRQLWEPVNAIEKTFLGAWQRTP